MQMTIRNRSELIAALTEAAEIEHDLCCLYLFAAFSLKNHPEEGGVTWPQLRFVQEWKSDVLLIARQEMEHLGIVANLLTAVGGTPHFHRTNFPKPPGYFGQLPALSLEPFSYDTVDSFVRFEEPEFSQLRRAILDALPHDSTTKLSTALEHVVRLLCINTQWDLGEIWYPDAAAGELRLGYVYHLGRHASSDDTHHFQSATKDRLEEGAPHWWDAQLATQAFESRKVARRPHEDAPATDTGGMLRSVGLTSRVAIPVLEHDRRDDDVAPVAVLVFAYEDYDDDGTIKMAYQALNEPHGDQCLAELYRAQPGPAAHRGAPQVETASPESEEFATIGALYRMIDKGFCRLDRELGGAELFIGPSGAQVSNTSFPEFMPPGWFNINLVPTTDLKAARQAIVQIIEEGEGTAGDKEDSHYWRFRGMRDRLHEMQQRDPDFAPARPVASNPVRSRPPGAPAESLTEISDPFTRRVSALHDDAYETMLLVLMRFYSYMYFGDPDGKAANVRMELLRVFPQLMTMALRPLAEILTELPVGRDHPGLTAGPLFETNRSIVLLPHRTSAWTVILERLEDMAETARKLQENPSAPQRMKTIADNLERLSADLAFSITGEWSNDGNS